MWIISNIKVESTLHISDTTVKNPFPRTIVGAQDGIRTLCPQSPKSAHQPMDLWASGLIAFWSSGEPGPQGHKPPSTALTSLAEMAHAFAGGTSAICRCPHDPGRAALVSRPRHRLCVLASSLPTPAIEGQGVELSVTTRRGRVLPVLKDCSLRVPPGQLWMLLGPNGCGKSTLLKVLHLLYPPELRRASSFCAFHVYFVRALSVFAHGVGKSLVVVLDYAHGPHSLISCSRKFSYTVRSRWMF